MEFTPQGSFPHKYMKILKETKIQLVSFAKDIITASYCQELEAAGICIKRKPKLTLHATHQAHPLIWLLVFDNPQQIIETDFRRYHANNESFIFLVNDPLLTLNDSIEHPVLSLSCPVEELQQILLSQEQYILQRNLFQSSDIDDELFLQLHFYGRSTAFVQTMKMVQRLASTDNSVFIKGETGTGKELTARSIHYLSSRKIAPFIPINCGAFNDDLILSELFGYEKGAFTGASKSKQGLLEIADSGTVFLDEVDSLSSKAQVALLRYLQDNEIRSIGSHKIKKVDVRVVAASNKDIKELIKQEKFRDDLYYRLDVLTVNLPPLNQREEDIQLLAQYFIAQLAINNNNISKVFSQQVITAMQDYPWPGNVRELENFVKRAYLLTNGSIITDPNLLKGTPLTFHPKSSKTSIGKHFSNSFNEEKKVLISKFEKSYLHQILHKTKGNISKAADIAKKERRSFCRLMKKHGLERKNYLNI